VSFLIKKPQSSILPKEDFEADKGKLI